MDCNQAIWICYVNSRMIEDYDVHKLYLADICPCVAGRSSSPQNQQYKNVQKVSVHENLLSCSSRIITSPKRTECSSSCNEVANSCVPRIYCPKLAPFELFWRAGFWVQSFRTNLSLSSLCSTWKFNISQTDDMLHARLFSVYPLWQRVWAKLL